MTCHDVEMSMTTNNEQHSLIIAAVILVHFSSKFILCTLNSIIVTICHAMRGDFMSGTVFDRYNQRFNRTTILTSFIKWTAFRKLVLFPKDSTSFFRINVLSSLFLLLLHKRHSMWPISTRTIPQDPRPENEIHCGTNYKIIFMISFMCDFDGD